MEWEHHQFWRELESGAAVPCTMMEWAEQFEDNQRRQIGLWESEALAIAVSTVFLGLNHSFFGGPPLIYETMLFNSDRHGLNLWRYHTREAAEEGHARIVAALKAGAVPETLEVEP